jgi:DNA-binding CsgD family transcriptional regulator
MNRRPLPAASSPRPRARIVVRTHDPVLRAAIVEALHGLGDLAVEKGDPGGAAGAGTPAPGADGSDGFDAAVEASDGQPDITPREGEVLGLLAEGLANKEIAARLGFSAHTAKFHVESLLRKLDAANRAEAVREGIRRGLIGV